jgi:hypothetical protein
MLLSTVIHVDPAVERKQCRLLINPMATFLATSRSHMYPKQAIDSNVLNHLQSQCYRRDSFRALYIPDTACDDFNTEQDMDFAIYGLKHRLYLALMFNHHARQRLYNV